MTPLRYLAAMLVVLAAMAIAGRVDAQDGAHGVGHAELHADVYRQWKRPDMPWSHCCSAQSADDPNGDCRPTRAFLGDDGRWRAWDGRGWLAIPPSKLLPTDMAGDGRNHLCAAPDGRVFCFSPTSPKF